MKMVKVELPKALIPLFLELAESISDDMGNAGSNDFMIKDTPDNRELVELAEAKNVDMTLEEYREGDEYSEPQTYKGNKLCVYDIAIFDLFVSYFKELKNGR